MTNHSDVIDRPGLGRVSRSSAGLVLAARALRAFADGFVAVLLPAYLLALGLGQLEVGFLSTATLLGSALATLAVGRWGHRFALRRLLLGAALLMAATGLGFATMTALWPLLVVAFVGTLNPSGGDVSVFLPLEHTVLAASRADRGAHHACSRATASSARSSAPWARSRRRVPDWLATSAGWQMLDALRAMFVRLRGPRRRGLGALSADCPSRREPASARRRRRSGRRAASSCKLAAPVQRRFLRRRPGHQLAARAVAVRALRHVARRRPVRSSSGPGCSAPCRSSRRRRSRGASASSTRWCSRTFRPACA